MFTHFEPINTLFRAMQTFWITLIFLNFKKELFSLQNPYFDDAVQVFKSCTNLQDLKQIKGNFENFLIMNS